MPHITLSRGFARLALLGNDILQAAALGERQFTSPLETRAWHCIDLARKQRYSGYLGSSASNRAGLCRLSRRNVIPIGLEPECNTEMQHLIND